MKHKMGFFLGVLLAVCCLFQGCAQSKPTHRVLDLTGLTPFYTVNGASAPQIVGGSDRFAVFEEAAPGKTLFYATAWNSPSPLTRLGESGPALVSSSSHAMMGDCSYHVALEPDGEGVQLKLLRVDAANRQVTAVDILGSAQQVNPLVYLSKLSEEELLCGWMEGDTSSLICYNVKSRQKEVILEERATVYGELISGDLFSRASACDKLIYVLTNEIKDNLSNYALRVYDKSGTLQKVVSDALLDAVFEGTAPLDVAVVGDYVILENWNMEQAMFKLTGDGIEEIVPLDAGMRMIGPGLNSCHSSASVDYLVYRRKLTDELKSADQTLFFLNVKTGDVQEVLCQVGEGKSLGFGLVGENGFLVLSVHQTTKEGQLDFDRYELYHLTARQIWELLEEGRATPPSETPGSEPGGAQPPTTGAREDAVASTGADGQADPFANVDFQTVCDQTVAELQALELPIDVQIEVNVQDRYVRFIAAVRQKEHPEDRAYIAFEEEMIRCFHRNVELQMPGLKGPTEGYYGELFDTYEIRLCVFAVKSWYDMDSFAPGTHPALTLGPYGGGW